MSGPIKPADVGAAKAAHIPEAVFDAFNAEIALRFTHGTAKVPQKAIVERLVMAGNKRQDVFDCGWLNIEEAYRAVGWKVIYEKPGHNESGEPYFEFEAP